MSTLLTIISIIKNAGGEIEEAMAFISFLHSVIQLAESKESAVDKMDDILNATEAFLNKQFPSVAGVFGDIAKQVETYVVELQPILKMIKL